MHQRSFQIPLPKSWPTRVRLAMLHVISLAQFATAYTRGWAANCPLERVRLKAENVPLVVEAWPAAPGIVTGVPYSTFTSSLSSRKRFLAPFSGRGCRETGYAFIGVFGLVVGAIRRRRHLNLISAVRSAGTSCSPFH